MAASAIAHTPSSPRPDVAGAARPQVLKAFSLPDPELRLHVLRVRPAPMASSTPRPCP
jgi:hypothetical protein